ncbi:hypothetical protein [Faecalicoccus pleomorphus]|uniref:hypothetical protein n=1 Tax=Faecalicoccus pleomorphus TaxID=1323 RepID=UPI0022E1DD63|nr:hypothetical protein [Faecalicoccus pleomorphus]
MNRKKITKAALSGLVAVTMVPAMAAPLVANAESESKSSIINVVFTDENGNNVGGGDQWVDADGDGVFKATELDLPEGYELNGGGDYFVKDGKFTISVKKINKGTIINFTFVGVNGESLGGGDVIVDKDGDGIFNSSEIASIIPEGYKNDSLLGDFFVSEFENSSNVIALKKIYNSTIVNVQFIDENGTVVGGGDYFVDEDGDGIFKASELELPVGYKLNGGGDYFVTDPDINIPVTKINKGTIINVVFEDPQGNKLGGGDYVVDVDGDGIANYSELDLPVGIKCNW